MVPSVAPRVLALAFACGLFSCGAPQGPKPLPAASARAPADPLPRADPCGAGTEELGFQGLLRGARCQAEVVERMTETARALGVACDYCHERGDFMRATPMKDVANWMATKLAPSLRKRGGGAVECGDCHASNGHGVAKFLGTPRQQDLSVEWMTVVLAERFETAQGAPLYCRNCHTDDLGKAGFQKRVILTDRLPPLPPLSGSDD